MAGVSRGRTRRTAPPCPITGQPARRRIETLSSRFLANLWRRTAGVDVRRLFSDKPVKLWESPCGLAFFDPMVAGDDAFYGSFYGSWGAHALVEKSSAERPEYVRAGQLVPAGGTVLDVGSGAGAFARHVRHASYTGLDPHLPPGDEHPLVRREDLAEHAKSRPEHYDAVCAFQVIEHVTDPKGFAARMLSVLKPGGLFIVAAPAWPSPMTQIPNFVLNCPPHHLSWWNESAFRALAQALRLEVVRIELLPSYVLQSQIQWMSRFSPIKARTRHFSGRPLWYLSLSLAYGLARVAERLLGAPKKTAPIDIMLVARKPPA